MHLLMISGDRHVLQGKRSAFYYTLEELSKHFEHIDIITPRVKDAQLSPFANVTFHPSPKGLWYQPFWIRKKARGIQADTATVHCYPPFYNSLGALGLYIPFVIEVHHIVGDPTAASLSEWIGKWMTRLILPLISRKAKAVRVVNADVGAKLERWGIQNVNVVESMYLDKSSFETACTVTLRDRSEAEVVSKGAEQAPQDDNYKPYDLTFCARLVRNKGLGELLQATANIPGVTLQIIGDGPGRQLAEQEIRDLGIRDRVTLRGWMETQEDVWHAMQEGRVFVMNSKSEGGPRVLLEAMALGLPVISTSVGLAPSVIEDGVNGMITTGDTEDLVSVIQTVLEDPSLQQKMGSRAKEVLGKFDRTTLIKEYSELLKQGVEGAGGEKGAKDTRVTC